MASTGCGGGCVCGGGWDDDDDYDCGGYDDDYPYGVDLQFPDLGRDSGRPDSGADAEAPSCVVGAACAEVTGCPSSSARCFEPSTFGGPSDHGLGGADDPIRGHPDGEDTFVATPLFPGGYCTTSWPQDGATLDQCNVRGEDLVDPVCGACGKCTDIFGLDSEEGIDDFVPGFCALRCNPSLTESECREGYDCSLVDEVCWLGCQTDDECRISREESNGVPGIQSPADCDPAFVAGDPAHCTPADCDDASPADPEACASPELNFDGLVYDTESEALCDPATSRCVNRPNTPSAAGGDPCTEDSDCEPGGRCIVEDERWFGGSCTKDRCDLATNECANGGVCDRQGLGHFACFEGCTVGGFDADSDPSTWVTEGLAQTTCREGYGCSWSGIDPGGTENNGVCLPIEYDEAVTEPNIGASCAEDADCFSPFGNGFCLTGDGFPEGYCSVRNCGAPWFTAGTLEDQIVCGDSGFCISFDAEDPTFALCVQECSIAEECGAGLGCVDFTADRKACWPGCETSVDCRLRERCIDSACVPE